MSKKKLFLVAGFPGAGKTMIGRIMAALLQAPIFDQDTLCKDLVETGLRVAGADPDNRDTSLYADNFKMVEYGTTLKVAWENLRYCDTAIAVAPFVSPLKNEEWMAELRRKAQRMQVDWHFVWVESSPQARRELLLKRKTGRDRTKLENWEEYVKSVTDRPPLPAGRFTIIVNDAGNLKHVQAEIERFLVSQGLSPTNNQ